jgi:hypothetical protein
MNQQGHSSSQGSSYYSGSWGSQPSYPCGGYTQYYALIEEKANKEAKTLAQEYLRQSSKPCEDNKEKVFIVYKIIQTPIEAITTGM